MLGYSVYVQKLMEKPIHSENDVWLNGPRLVDWTTGAMGLGWIEELEAEGKATWFYGHGPGYPLRYISSFANVWSKIGSGPPPYEDGWTIGENYAAAGGGNWDLKFHPEEIAKCQPGDLVIIVCWDLS